MVASLWRIASGTKVPDRVFDSADELRLREQQFMRLRDRIEARAARKFSDVELGAILRARPARDRFSGAGEVRGAEGVGSNVLKFPVNQYERLFTTYGRFNMSHFGT